MKVRTKILLLLGIIVGIPLIGILLRGIWCHHYVMGDDIYVINEEAPTCFEEGSYYEIGRCHYCGKVLSLKRTIPVLHNIQNGACTACCEKESSIGLKFFKIVRSEKKLGSRYSKASYVAGYRVDGIGSCSASDITVGLFDNRPVVTIYSGAFKNYTRLKSLTIGRTVTKVYPDAFIGCENLTQFIVSENNSEYTSIDGNLYSKDGKTLVVYAKGKKESSITIPDGVTAIGDYAFHGCTDITSITLPDTVTSIGHLAFTGCESLTSVTFGAGLTSIGDGAFYNCAALKEISLPDSVRSIGQKAFKNTAYYRNGENWENNVLYIGKHLIKGTAAGTYTVREGTVSISDAAFRHCRQLKSVVIPESMVHIGAYAFDHCKELADIKYKGNKASWNKITVGERWDRNAPIYRVKYKEE